MKAVIHLDVPKWQIGKEVAVYFPDTMQKKAVCEKIPQFDHVPVQSLIDHIKTAIDVDPWAKEMAEKLLSKLQIVRCLDCRYRGNSLNCLLESEGLTVPDDWFCADGEVKDNGK